MLQKFWKYVDFSVCLTAMCVCVLVQTLLQKGKKLSTASLMEHQNRNKTTINQDLSGETFKEKKVIGWWWGLIKSSFKFCFAT